MRRRLVICLCVGLLLAVACVAWFDRSLKATDVAGYRPANASWVLVTDDMPAFLSGLRKAGYDSLCDGRPGSLLLPVEELVGGASGVELTGTNWRRWLGPTLLASASADGWGACIRLGVFARTSWNARSLFEGDAPGDGIWLSEGVYHGWREGFLILSRSRPYVEQALRSEVEAIPEGLLDNEILLTSLGPFPCVLYVQGSRGLPLRGHWSVELPERTGSLGLADAWPEPPLASVTASSFSEIDTILRALLIPVLGEPRVDEAAGLLGRFGASLEVDAAALPWLDHGDAYSLAVADVDTSEPLPVPEIACVIKSRRRIRGAKAMAPVFEASPRFLPYEWNGYAGARLPLYGEKAALCISHYERFWLATSQEPLMARLVGALRPVPPLDAAMALRLDWEKAGRVCRALAAQALTQELIGREWLEAAEEDWGPLSENLGGLGSLVIDGRHGDTPADGLMLSGFLARAEGESP